MITFHIYTILMAVFNIVNGVLTYKIFKQLSMGASMEKNKEVSNAKEDDTDEPMAEELDGLQVNAFMLGADSYLSTKDSFFISRGNPESSNPSGGDVNVPILTHDEEMPEDEEKMLNRLLYLSDFLNKKHDDGYKTPTFLNQDELDNIKWETINETYCFITVDLPRNKAEIVRNYFRNLDVKYRKKDGTTYTKVVDGKLAKEIIEDLICAYPWHEVDDNKIPVNWDGVRKEDSADNQRVFKQEPEDNAYGEKLKYAIGNLSKSVEKLNEILSSK